MGISLEQHLADSFAPVQVKYIHGDLGLTFLDLEEFKRIFIEDDRRVDLLNDVAPAFFNRLHRLYIVSFIVTIGRYLDKPNYRKSENISLSSLRKLSLNLPFTEQLERLFLEVMDVAKPLIEVRNKIVAHSDASTLLSEEGYRFEVLIKDIERVLLITERILNLFFQHFDGSTRSWQRLPPTGGSLSLIHRLESGAISTLTPHTHADRE